MARRRDIIDTKKEFKRVGTHDGRFHADEVMATAILKELYDLEVVRTRDMEVLAGLDIVYLETGKASPIPGLESGNRSLTKSWA